MSISHCPALRLTVGELAFAVAQLTSYEKAVQLVSTQFAVERTEDALLLIQASGQSLHARELATQLAPTVQLTSSMTMIGRIFGQAEWLMRCSRVLASGVIDSLLLHLSPSGVLAHEVITEHVQRIMPLPNLEALLALASDLFHCAYAEGQSSMLSLARDTFDAIWVSNDEHAIEALLVQSMSPCCADLIRTGLAKDLASPQWKGGISTTHYPPGGDIEVSAALYLAAGRHTWLCEPISAVSVSITEASRRRFADAALRAIERIPACDRRFEL